MASSSLSPGMMFLLILFGVWLTISVIGVLIKVTLESMTLEAAQFVQGILGAAIFLAIFSPLSRESVGDDSTDARVAIPFHLVVEIIRDPWEPLTGPELWNKGRLNLKSIMFWCLGLPLILTTGLVPLVSLLTLPQHLATTIGNLDRRPDLRGLACGSLAALLLLIALVALNLAGRLRLPCWMSVYLLWMVLINVTAFAVYVSDKHRAEQKLWRTSEIELRYFPLLGGIFGTAIGMALMNHKTSETKARFRQMSQSNAIVHMSLVAAWVVFSSSPLMDWVSRWYGSYCRFIGVGG